MDFKTRETSVSTRMASRQHKGGRISAITEQGWKVGLRGKLEGKVGGGQERDGD